MTKTRILLAFVLLLLVPPRVCSTPDPVQIIINEAVRKEMKSYAQRRECFVRMDKYKKSISRELTIHHLPVELLAIPVVESCYENIHSPYGWGSGIWMFIKPTARNYGLKINKESDQRLDVKRSTHAAVKYLKHLHTEFHDWHLAIIAYNLGEFSVKKTIRKKKKLNQEYLWKVMAVIILMKKDKALTR